MAIIGNACLICAEKYFPPLVMCAKCHRVRMAATEVTFGRVEELTVQRGDPEIVFASLRALEGPVVVGRVSADTNEGDLLEFTDSVDRFDSGGGFVFVPRIDGEVNTK